MIIRPMGLERWPQGLLSNCTSLMAMGLICAWCSAVFAQTKIGNSEVDYFVQTSGGSPVVCGVEFTIVFSDFVQGKGEITSTVGSISFAESKRNFVLLLKVQGLDFPDGPTKPVRFKVASASLTADGANYKADNVGSCDEPLGFCGTYWLPKSALIRKGIGVGREITLNFNRRVGDFDYQVPIYESVTTVNMEHAKSFNQCMGLMTHRLLDGSK